MLAAALMLAACTQQAEAPPPAPVVSDAPAGEYTLDPSHADLSFRVNHIGFRCTPRALRRLTPCFSLIRPSQRP